MDNANMLSASDVALLTDRNTDGFCGNSLLYFFAILFLFGNGGFGGWGNNRGENYVTEADLCNANSFSELKNSIGRLNDNQAAIARQTDNGICQLGYQGLQNTNSIQQQLSDCCCTTQRGIDSVKFDMANYTNSLQVSQMEGTQKVLDKLCAMESAQKDAIIAQQGQRIAALEADARMCGVLRWPTTASYAVNCNPFSGNTCAY